MPIAHDISPKLGIVLKLEAEVRITSYRCFRVCSCIRFKTEISLMRIHCSKLVWDLFIFVAVFVIIKNVIPSPLFFMWIMNDKPWTLNCFLNLEKKFYFGIFKLVINLSRVMVALSPYHVHDCVTWPTQSPFEVQFCHK